MSRLLTFALLLAACGKKSAPEAPAPADKPVAVAPAPAPAPAPEPAPAETTVEVAKRPNASFDAVITFANGKVVQGRVNRVERGEDWYAESGWTDKDTKLTVSLQADGTEIDAKWSDLKSIDIDYAGRSSISCDYDSAFTPLMYTCTMGTTTKAVTQDGKAWLLTTRHKWKFGFESGTDLEFYAYKLPARVQEAEEAEIGDGSTQSDALYKQLQDQLMQKMTQDVVKSIRITPR